MVEDVYKYTKNYSILRLVVTRDCNLNCKYCFVKKDSFKNMDYKTAKNAVDYFLKTPGKQKSLTFFGGEPLLKFSLIKKITTYFYNKSKDKKIHFYMPTNGTIYNKEIGNFLKKNNFTMSVSLDGPNEIQMRNRPLKKGGKNFNQIIKNIKNLRATRVNAVVIPENAKYLEEIFLSLIKTQVDTISLDIARNVAWGKKELLEYQSGMNLISNYCIKNIWPSESDRRIYPFHDYFVSFLLKKEEDLTCCKANEQMMTITPTGEIIPCVDFLRYDEEDLKRYSAGNINESLNLFNFKKIEEIMSFSINKCVPLEGFDHIKQNLVCSLKDYKNKSFTKNQLRLNCLLDEINYRVMKKAFIKMKENEQFIKKLKKSTFEDECGKKEI